MVVSKKAMKHYLDVEAYENPIQKVLENKQIMEKNFKTKDNWQKKLGISRVKATQVLNLLKLPQEQQNYILEYEKNDNGKKQKKVLLIE